MEGEVLRGEAQLTQVIQQWSDLVSVERFLASVEELAASLVDEHKAEVLARLALAREFLGTQNPLDFFLRWRTPAERYRSRYDGDEGDSGEDDGAI